MRLTVAYCGEQLLLDGGPFTIGRGGDLAIDDNPYLHRYFLRIDQGGGFWWLDNVGNQLTATVADGDGAVQAWLAPGARLPLVFARTVVRFTAGPTTYELELHLDEPTFASHSLEHQPVGETTIGPPTLTRDQKLLILSLAEPALRREGHGASSVPSSADAARRLGWASTKFNRKLDNVCQKLARAGVPGLHGAPGDLASNRRARLVEYALAARMVTPLDLALLDEVVTS